MHTYKHASMEASASATLMLRFLCLRPARQQIAIMLLLGSFSQLYQAAPTSNTTADTSCAADAGEICNNITTYNAIERGAFHSQEIRLHLTSSQLRANMQISTISNLNNHYQYRGSLIRFFEARDNSTGNDVCNQIGIKLFSTTNLQSGFKCPWEYKCDYDPRRIPQVMWQAYCSQNSTWQCSCPDETGGCSECIPINRKCEPVYYPVPILYSNRCYPFNEPGNWEWSHMNVAVACTTSNENSF